MGSRGSTFLNDLLKLIFNAVAISNIADNAASGALSNLYVSLHTATPGAGGNQTTNECTYGDYNRVAVARTSGGFTVSGATVHPAADVVFPTAISGSETATFVGIGTAAYPGTGKLLYFGPLDPNIVIVNTVQPKVKSTSTDTET